MGKIHHIYKIIKNNTPIYIGVTSQKLKQRLHQHITDRNSAVYQLCNPNFHDVYIELINILIKNENTYSIDIKNSQTAYTLEKTLTYIYGYTFPLVNINAGNTDYQNLNNIEIYSMVHDFLFNVVNENIILPSAIAHEILMLICNICKYNISPQNLSNIINSLDNNKYLTLLNMLDDICCEYLCETLEEE